MIEEEHFHHNNMSEYESWHPEEEVSKSEKPQSIEVPEEKHPISVSVEEEKRISFNLAQEINSIALKSMTKESKEREESTTKPSKKKWSRRDFLKAAVGGTITAVGTPLILEAGSGIISHIKRRHEVAKIKELTKIEVNEIAEKYGFKAQLKIENSEGPYILFIGQIHHSPDIDQSPDIASQKVKELVIEVQENIERFLLELSEMQEKPMIVFDEGMSEYEIELLKSVKKVKEAIESFGFSVDAYDKIVDLHIKILIDKIEAIKIETGGAIHCLPDVQQQLNYVFQSRIRALDEYFEKNPTIFQRHKYKLKYSRERAHNLVLSNRVISQYYHGAVRKMYVDGAIDIRPAESILHDSKWYSIYREKDQLLDELKNTQDNKKKLEIKDTIGQLEKKEKKFIYDEREDASIELIMNDRDIQGQKLIPLVFGRAHDYTDNVNNYNQKHPEKKTGLIDLRYKK